MAVANSTSPGVFQRDLYKKSAGVPTLVALMQIFHFYAENLHASSKHRGGSLNGCASVLSHIFKGKDLNFKDIESNLQIPKKGPRTLLKSQYDHHYICVDVSNVKKRWYRLCGNAALLYSASTINTSDGSNLLNRIRDGKASFEEDGALSKEWLGKGCYCIENILPHILDPDHVALNPTYMHQIERVEIVVPAFDDLASAAIRKEFRKHG